MYAAPHPTPTHIHTHTWDQFLQCSRWQDKANPLEPKIVIVHFVTGMNRHWGMLNALPLSEQKTKKNLQSCTFLLFMFFSSKFIWSLCMVFILKAEGVSVFQTRNVWNLFLPLFPFFIFKIRLFSGKITNKKGKRRNENPCDWKVF